MYSASDLRKGLKVEIDSQPYAITDFTFTKPGKGQSIYTCKLKNMINGSTLTKQYRSNDKIDKPALAERTLQYSYLDGANYVFMDENYEQVLIGVDVIGEKKYFLQEDVDVEVLFYNGQPVDITLPNFIERTVTYTEPGARGDTATNVLKPAVVDGGYEVPVPLFVDEGDLIRIDTRTGDYADRVKK
jgi:elongation factor P